MRDFLLIGSSKSQGLCQNNLRYVAILNRELGIDRYDKHTPYHYTTEYKSSYHGDVVVILNDLADFPHLLVHVAGPDLADDLTRICKCSWHLVSG